MKHQLTRRQALRAGLALGLSAAVAPVLASPAGKRQPLIDCHVHLTHGYYVQEGEPITVKHLLHWMDAHGLSQAVVLPLVSPESTTYLQLPDVALQAAKEHPDRLVPFCSIDPRAIVSGGAKGLARIIQKYVDRGAKGFGEHKVGLNFDDPLMMQVYEACETVGIPLLFHIDGIRGKDDPGLPRLEHALSTFPKLDFIGHGPGWWASISGNVKDADGYPTGPVEPGGAIDRLMDAYSNLFGDLSAGSGANAISRDKQFGREFMIRRQDRLMFGTDYLQPGQAVPQFELFESLHLPADVQAKIFKQNAQRVIKIT